jgi:hypothetical protein
VPFAADLRDLVDVPLALELFFADAMSFIPVQLGEPEPAVPQPDSRDAFHLPPAALTIQAPEPGQLTDALADSDRLDVLQLTDELEVHRTILAACPGAFLATRLLDADPTLRGRSHQKTVSTGSAFAHLPRRADLKNCANS